MAVGAAYGPGVYLGKSFGVAYPYAIQPDLGAGVPWGASAALLGGGGGAARPSRFGAIAIARATPGPALREIPYPGGAYACTDAAAMELTHLLLLPMA